MTDQSLSRQLFTQLQGAPMQQIAQQLGTSPEQTSKAVSQALPLLMGALGNQASNQPQNVQALLGGASGGQGSGGLGEMLGGILGGGGQGGGAGGLGGLLGGLLGGGNTGAAGSADAAGAAGAPGAGAAADVGAGAGAGAPDAGVAGVPPAGGAPGQAGGGMGDVLGNIFGGKQDRAAEGLGQSSGLGSAGAAALLATLTPIVLSFLKQRFSQGGSGSASAPGGDVNEALTAEREQIRSQGGGGLLDGFLDQNGDGKLDMNDVVKLGSSLLGGGRR